MTPLRSVRHPYRSADGTLQPETAFYLVRIKGATPDGKTFDQTIELKDPYVLVDGKPHGSLRERTSRWGAPYSWVRREPDLRCIKARSCAADRQDLTDLIPARRGRGPTRVGKVQADREVPTATTRIGDTDGVLQPRRTFYVLTPPRPDHRGWHGLCAGRPGQANPGSWTGNCGLL